jgi:S1 RNA binding domain protein
MELEVCSVLEGKVTGITKFGAFVALPGGKSGLVHISEIAYSYVSDVKDFLTEGQDVKVKVINIDENGRINLSIKKASPPPQQEGGRGNGRPRYNGNRDSRDGGRDGGYDRGRREGSGAPRDRQNRTSSRSGGNAATPPPTQAKGPVTFEDQLKKFMQESDSRQSDLNRYSDKRSSRRSNGRGRNSY